MRTELTSEHRLLLEYLALCPEQSHDSVEQLRLQGVVPRDASSRNGVAAPTSPPTSLTSLSDDELLDADGPTFGSEASPEQEKLIKEAAQLLRNIGDKWTMTVSHEQMQDLLCGIVKVSTKEALVGVMRNAVQQSVSLLVGNGQSCSMQQTQAMATIQLMRRAMIEAHGVAETVSRVFNAAAFYLKELGGWKIVSDEHLYE
ncbi:uncharacterized protein LOC133340568 [Lethenteron reissneri]|uniref:uncharacterized protein LOC133340568 n=1 Tax=Lethenteron reissneri TaxID=7753 RepID=UPI002AB70139|nr:uncharacterized protein LOC133340568 [Lethenteron reissneri]